MSHTNEPTSGTDSTPYTDASMSCGCCDYALKPTYEQAFNLVKLQPIKCDQCGSALLLAETDRLVLDQKLQTAARMGKLAVLILGPYFLIGLVSSIYFGFFAVAPFPGFSGVLVVGGIALGFALKSASTDDTQRRFVLLTHSE
ncbi:MULTISPECIES: hypothetical protein [unclassified Pseudomonas]|uniref:hypothetical protein n=1 Tax=unclassified Pseudomonas TaxID=196821 RepID=UPI002AC9237F|nr:MULTISPECIES: hypothetical protein [unclassified Pseudomonas]MEB0044831.1 hypothetical protein [Pseudomonas sp. Dout3]MEB0096202.1 hypothetical protein [Pseudomonas sp. DC1.2]WPX59393.1 hypothetical protein RHM68_01725 [Pseudomonas sp. DC1.2]